MAKTATKKKTSQSATFNFNRSTKNTVRFDEEGDDREEHIMSSAYVRHSALEEMGLDPTDEDLKVKVTVTPA